jgi:TRAP-type C4-dicarboxylate transport system substrate-binding protein
VAVHPGPLRRPFGLSHGLAGPEDYRGARIGIRPGAVAQATFRALGGVAKGYVPGSLSGLDGVEIDPKTVAYNGWDRQGGFLTANVVLWPKPYSIVMNREAFEALTSEQQEILLAAGRAALVSELRQTERDEAAAMSELCNHGQLSLVAVSADELGALRAAVQPVYDELERDVLTRELISAIDGLRGTLAKAPALPHCVKTGSSMASGAAPLDGRWKLTWTRDELIAVGIPESNLKGARPKRAR